MTVTIQEDFTLPSKGMTYNKQFDPTVKLRSMTVADEMKRLTQSKYPYKQLCDMIEDCLVTKLPIHVYDMCLGDYIFLLHKLRTVTYGPDYQITYVCPYCGSQEKATINLDELKINEYTKEFDKLTTITLPQSKRVVKLKLQTPRDVDNIAVKSEELKKEYPDMPNPAVLLTIQSFIAEIDNEPVNPALIGEQLKNWSAVDYNYLSQKALQLNEKVGIDSMIKLTCSKCGHDVNTTFRYTEEFFRPTVY